MAHIKFPFQVKNELEKGGRRQKAAAERECPNCHHFIPMKALLRQNYVCDCGYHFKMKARQRLMLLCDDGTFQEMFSELTAHDPLNFPGYQQKIDSSKIRSGESEGVICGKAKINGNPCYIFVMEGAFMMGSMGTIVGEKITRCIEAATKDKLPVIGCTMSGGARMQEGTLSLMQMAKTAGALKRHSDAGLLSIMLLCNPTAGGVTASLAMGGDILISEPEATICFAGARVIEQTTHEKLPKGFQTAEFLLEHGFLDDIVTRDCEKEYIGKILKWHMA